jgi:hypothetical protein
LIFFQDTANGTTLGTTVAWNPPFLEVSSTLNLSVPAGGTLFLHTAGTAATLTQGWGEVTGSAGLSAYAIYTYESYAGRPNQDGTSQATASSTRILVPFDATTGYSTGVAVVNPTGLTETISVNLQTDAGAISQATLPALPANGQLAFSMATQFPAVAGHRGLAEFYDVRGQLSIAAFRINPTIALTSLPVVLTSGSPVIGGTSQGSLPQYSQIVFSNFTSNAPGLAGITVNTPMPGGAFGSGTAGGSTGSGSSPLNYEAQWSNLVLNGSTLTFSALATGVSEMFDSKGNAAPISSGTLTSTLGGALATNGISTGTATGTIALFSSLGSVSGSFNANYTAE